MTQASLAVAPSDPKRLFAAVRTPEDTKFYRSDDAGGSLGIRRNGHASDTADRVWRSRRHPVRPEKRRRHLCRQHRYVEIDRHRQNVEGVSRRARRRRLPEDLDKSGGRQHHAVGSDQGAIVTVNGGAVMELLVQPADRADVPRQCGQRVSLSPVQRSAGKRFSVCFEPGRLRRDNLPRLDAGGRGGIRLRRRRSARSRHRLRRQTLRASIGGPARRRTSCRKPFAVRIFA